MGMAAGQEAVVVSGRRWRRVFCASFRAAFLSGPDLAETGRASEGAWKEEEGWV